MEEIEEYKTRIIDSIIGDANVPDADRVRTAIRSTLFVSEPNDKKNVRRVDLINALYLMAKHNYKPPSDMAGGGLGTSLNQDPILSDGVVERETNISVSFETESQPQLSQEPVKNYMDVKFVKKVCPYYRKGVCKFGIKGTRCEGEHPKQCSRFLKFGLARFHEKGCTKQCTNFHPIVCRESLSTRTCSVTDCKFKHLKRTAKKQMPNLHLASHIQSPTLETMPHPPTKRDITYSQKVREYGHAASRPTRHVTTHSQSQVANIPNNHQMTTDEHSFLVLLSQLTKGLDEQRNVMQQMLLQIQNMDQSNKQTLQMIN